MTDQNLLLREDGYPHLNTDIGENMSYEKDIFKLAHEAGFQSHAKDKNSIIVRHSNGGWVDVTGAVFRFAEAIRALPLPESSIQHKNMICMAECMDMVRSELIEMGVINSSVPPMMIADAVGDKLKESTEALRKENEQLRQRIAELESNKAVSDVIAERRRQIEVEGFTPERDDTYTECQLSDAAGCYAMFSSAYPAGDPIHYWPWDKTWWKPSDDERRNRVKAAALLIADIERLDRAALKGGVA